MPAASDQPNARGGQNRAEQAEPSGLPESASSELSESALPVSSLRLLAGLVTATRSVLESATSSPMALESPYGCSARAVNVALTPPCRASARLTR